MFIMEWTDKAVVKGSFVRVKVGRVLALGSALGMAVGAPVALSSFDSPLATAALTLFAADAAAQTLDGDDCGNIPILCSASDSESGDGGSVSDVQASGGNGGRGGNGGFATLHDVANAHADASSSVVIDDVTTGDAIAHQVNVDARGATRPVVVLVAGSFLDTGVDVFATVATRRQERPAATASPRMHLGAKPEMAATETPTREPATAARATAAAIRRSVYQVISYRKVQLLPGHDGHPQPG
jgi:hypothetical protein